MLHALKLKGRIIAEGYTIETLAEAIGISVATLYRKMRDNGRSMLIRDVYAIAQVLHLTGEDINEIFFNKEIA